jgi:AhpD family alkylhydroperoxidase
MSELRFEALQERDGRPPTDRDQPPVTRKGPTMPANVFDVFMSRHEPLTALVDHANEVLWKRSALDPEVKEAMRIALAEAIGCSYCARFRTAGADGAITPQQREQARRAADYAVAIAGAAGGVDDELTVETQRHFSAAEFSDLVFSIGWFIGMQHVGRTMHWDDSCPVAPIRELVERGEAT